jgi:hypothetical protein
MRLRRDPAHSLHTPIRPASIGEDGVFDAAGLADDVDDAELADGAEEHVINGIFPMPDPQRVLTRTFHDGPVPAVLMRDNGADSRVGNGRCGVIYIYVNY